MDMLSLKGKYNNVSVNSSHVCVCVCVCVFDCERERERQINKNWRREMVQGDN